ncbi:NAD(P)/FAD-dependent oxidoreductase [Microbacterium sp. WHRI 7836]|uniref:phytoene desaturase family protein n=1 Tax=Microbacterium TaxID=33882 RepID=UPI0032EC6B3D
MRQVDAVVVGAGPNGLAAALTLAREGLSVELFDQDEHLGGGCRTETWGDGYLSDWGAAVHPMALASPFFRSVGLTELVEFAIPEISFAHPLADRAAIAWRSLEQTADDLGRDGRSWRALMAGLVDDHLQIADAVLSPPPTLALHPLVGMRLAKAAVSAYRGAGLRTPGGQALLAGVVGHSVGRQPQLGTSAVGVVLAALAHSVGWPIPLGGSAAITRALSNELERLGVAIHRSVKVCSMQELPRARAYLFDTSARDLLTIAQNQVNSRYVKALRRVRPGDAVSKVDLILSGPIPWSDPRLSDAGTVHLGGTAADIREAEQLVAAGRHSASPAIVLSQPSRFDPTRAPGGLHSVWAYSHVPAGSPEPQTDVVVSSIEKHAPGVRDLLVTSRATTARDIADRNPTMVAGDFASGAITTRQILARPNMSPTPWRAARHIYLCSAATAPGPGVHGMSGFGAARTALRDHFA